MQKKQKIRILDHGVEVILTELQTVFFTENEEFDIFFKRDDNSYDEYIIMNGNNISLSQLKENIDFTRFLTKKLSTSSHVVISRDGTETIGVGIPAWGSKKIPINFSKGQICEVKNGSITHQGEIFSLPFLFHKKYIFEDELKNNLSLETYCISDTKISHRNRGKEIKTSLRSINLKIYIHGMYIMGLASSSYKESDGKFMVFKVNDLIKKEVIEFPLLYTGRGTLPTVALIESKIIQNILNNAH
jgi:hypothetical protein